MTIDHCHLCAPDRRQFLAGLAAIVSADLIGIPAAIAQTGGSPFANRNWIDVHHHLVPPGYLTKVPSDDAVPGASATPRRALEEWSVEHSIDQMDRSGVGTSILSISNPGIWFGDTTKARRLARDSNEYAATLVAAYPKRFGMFAALPLPDVEGSLREIEYALDVLKADGIGLYTSYGNKWLGDPAFDPIFAELNRRKALVNTHPTTADCCRNVQAAVSPNVVEYQTDTTRAIAGILASGTASRFPDVRIIFSHAGGTMPFLIERFVGWAKSPAIAKQLPKGLNHELERFYYDTAQTSNNVAMGALKALVPTSQILFGTDYPFRTVVDHVRNLAECGVFNEAQLAAIGRGNALALFPRLGA
ncbi:amidohydrolase family protein [Cupriavidus sp. CV2]|uniref:amidohydrolase family protein n=1 Tax=Cupriavidus ulmosensis TaxID=3065913 RepID=UPI00296B2B17|nr:amidohydrolase family protein [Cupriavidus sp. CV2]MDW3684498.1 amidohydrolase family protein [Cupriavidus sp. CV2]